MSWTVQQQNSVFAAIHKNYFISILRGDIRIKFWSNARRVGWVACSAIWNLSTNSAFALGPKKTTVKDFEFAGRRTFRLRGPCWTVFSGSPCNTLTSDIHSTLPSCLSDHCQDGTALLGKFQSHFRCVRIVVTTLCYFHPFVCLSVFPHVTERVPLDGLLWNWRLGSVMKICQEIPNLVKIGQKYLAFAWRPNCVLLLPTILNLHKTVPTIQIVSHQEVTKVTETRHNVMHTLPALFLIKLTVSMQKMSFVSPTVSTVSISLALRTVNGPSACTYAY